jgi:hypothetical protein
MDILSGHTGECRATGKRCACGDDMRGLSVMRHNARRHCINSNTTARARTTPGSLSGIRRNRSQIIRSLSHNATAGPSDNHTRRPPRSPGSKLALLRARTIGHRMRKFWLFRQGIVRMFRFVTIERHAASLMPPSREDWLGKGQLARILVKVVDQWDPSNLRRHYVERSVRAHHQTTPVGILVHGEAIGVFSCS